MGAEAVDRLKSVPQISDVASDLQNKGLQAYVDIDRDYFNDNSLGGEGYAAIDVNPGYQRLKGKDALDYVRYRHTDNDFIRAARQQDFLRQAKDQIGLGRLFGDRKELLRIFGRYTDTDLHSNSAILRLLA